ncbi:MAG: MgtC/SapB family protein [Candidatus Omnitrophica bacterium]|nr:MgtC/SapB family protein [Candidatus Omnitrophota bacterium]MBU1871394.1 MgtC/SapB family protein [Candidatus Omnitrophota bacterium]
MVGPMIGPLGIIGRLVLALLTGGVIGFEREVKRRSAGLRTHILVSLGSCLIMLTSLYVFDIYKDSGINIDPSRIAAGVITGIGFLGAGTIIRSGEAVKGLTSAATLWLVAGIGLGIGCGFYLASIVTTILAIAVLFFLGRLEKSLVK